MGSEKAIPEKQVDIFSALFLLLASLVYLTFEVSFNASLLDVASNINATEDELNNVENFGRTMSGVGLMLLVIGSLASQSYRIASKKMAFFLGAISIFMGAIVLYGEQQFALVGSNIAPLIFLAIVSTFLSFRLKNRSFIAVGIFAATTFFSMFYGQKVLLDTYIEQSNWQTRSTAQYMTLLKSGLQNNIIEIEGLPFDNGVTRPEKKTFLALMGGLVMGAPSFLDNVKEKRDEIIHKTVTNTSTHEFDASYSEYQRIGRQFEGQWKKYRKASQDYDKLVNGDQTANKAFKSLLAKRKDMYTKYRRSVDRFMDAIDRKAKTLKQRLRSFYNQYSNCGQSKSCRQSKSNFYKKEMQKEFGSNLDLFYWCTVAEKSLGQHVNTAITTVIGGVFDILGTVLTGNDPNRRNQSTNFYDCSSNAVTLLSVKKKLIPLKEYEFEKKSGYSIALYSKKADFFIHTQTVNNLRRLVKKQGLNVSNTWDHTGRAEFIEAYNTKYKKGAKKRWSLQIKNIIGEYIEPMLGYKQFVAHDVIQQQIKSKMGSDYIPKMMFEMNKKTFKRKVFDPKIEESIKKQADMLESAADLLGNGQTKETEGKQFLRSILVPPIALLLSLSMAILTLGKNGAALVGLVLRLPYVRDMPSSIRKSLQYLSIAIAAGIIFIMPFKVNNAFTNSNAFSFFIEKSREDSLTWSVITEWVMRMEPIAYPVGSVFLTMPKELTMTNFKDTFMAAHASLPEDELNHHSEAQLKTSTSFNDSIEKVCQAPMTVMAHRGGASNIENSIQGSKDALNSGYDGIEIDLMTLADGRWVVHHDPILGRTTELLSGKARKVSSLTTSEWKRVRFKKTGGDAPFLYQIIEQVNHHNQQFNLEIKGKPSRESLIKLDTYLKRKVNGHFQYSSLDLSILKTLRQLNKTVYLGLIQAPEMSSNKKKANKITNKFDALKEVIINKYSLALGVGVAENLADSVYANKYEDYTKKIEKITTLGNAGLHLDMATVKRAPGIISQIRSKGLKVFTYDIDEPSLHRSFISDLEIKPDGVITDLPYAKWCNS